MTVEIGLPDAVSRRRLFDVYARDLPLDLDEALLDDVVQRTDGVTASFMKELLRRAVLEALAQHEGPLQRISGEHLTAALDDLLDSSQAVTRALLGVRADQSGPVQLPPAGGGRGGHRGMAWVAGSGGAFGGGFGGFESGEEGRDGGYRSRVEYGEE